MIKFIEDDVFKKDLKNLLIIFLLAFVLFFPSFYNLNFFWDDEKYIFLNPDFLNASHFYDFWIPGKLEYRTWSMGYSLFWLLQNLFVYRPIILFKILNIIIHTFNAFLVGKLIKNFTFKKEYLIYSLLFLIHPLHVETVSWIFQLLTLLSTTFFLMSIHFFTKGIVRHSRSKIFLSYLFFFFSIQTKSIFIFCSFIYIFILWFFKKPFKEFYKAFPFFVISLVIGLISLGNASHFNSKARIKVEAKIPPIVKNFNLNEISTNIPARDSLQKQSDIANYQLQFSDVELTSEEKNYSFNRFEIFNQASWYYFKNLILPTDNFFLYPKTKISVWKTFIFFICLILIPIFLYLRNKDKIFLFIPSLFFLTLLPFIGTTFIPYFFWSNISDHYAYATCIIIPILFIVIEKNIPSISRFFVIVLFAFFSLNCFSYGLTFNNPTILYEKIINQNIHPRLLTLLFQEYLIKGDRFQMERILNISKNNFPNRNSTKKMQKQFEIYQTNF